MDIKSEFIQRYLDWRESLSKKERHEEEKNLRLLDDFRRDYASIQSIKGLTLSQYAIHKGHKNTFCYRVETQLHDFGEIRGKMCSYYLYGIAFNQDGSAIFHRNGASKNRFGSNPDDVFSGVLIEIENIYRASINEDDNAVEGSKLSGFFASKLSYLFNPDCWMPIYGKDDLSALCMAFGLSGQTSRTLMRRHLMDFMKSTGIDGITPYLFMRFCYSKEGYRGVLRPQNVGLSVQADDPISFLRYQRIETAETMAEKKRTGTLGEQIVLRYLKQHRAEMGIVGPIDAPCLRGDDACHYDFKYPTAGGDRYVEAKASKCNLSSPIFYLSPGERDFMTRNRDHYMIFFVNNVYGNYSIKPLSPEEVELHLQSTGFCYRT